MTKALLFQVLQIHVNAGNLCERSKSVPWKLLIKLVYLIGWKLTILANDR